MHSLALAGDRRHFFSAWEDRTVRLQSLEGELVATFEGHESFVNSVALVGDGRIVTGSWDKTVRFWPVELLGKAAAETAAAAAVRCSLATPSLLARPCRPLTGLPLANLLAGGSGRSRSCASSHNRS